MALFCPTLRTPSKFNRTNSLQYCNNSFVCVRSAIVIMGITLNKSQWRAIVRAANDSNVGNVDNVLPTSFTGKGCIGGKDVPINKAVCSFAAATATARCTPGTRFGSGCHRTPSWPNTFCSYVSPHVHKCPSSVNTAVWFSEAEIDTTLPPPFSGSIPVTNCGADNDKVVAFVVNEYLPMLPVLLALSFSMDDDRLRRRWVPFLLFCVPNGSACNPQEYTCPFDVNATLWYLAHEIAIGLMIWVSDNSNCALHGRWLPLPQQ